MSLFNAVGNCCVYKWIRDEYRYLYLTIAIPSLLIVVTWIWKNNQIGLSWWCNQLASFILMLIYTVIFCHFGWKMIHMYLHGVVFYWAIFHIFLPLVEYPFIDILDLISGQQQGLFRWWSKYWWVSARDGPMILSSIIGVIMLRYSLIWKMQSSDSNLYVPVDEPSVSSVPQRSICRRRWRHRTSRKFRCVLVRSVVFGINVNRRDRHHHRYFRHYHRRY